MSELKNLKKFLWYCGIEKDDYEMISARIWRRNLATLRITIMLSLCMSALFLVINLIQQSGLWYPYAFLLGASAIIFMLVCLMNQKADKHWSILLCYAQMLIVCIYAAVLSAQPGNYDIPATSIIVFISLLPIGIDDRPVRMYTVMFLEMLTYLLLSAKAKSAHAFSLDVMNGATFLVVGFVLYGVICKRNIHEIFNSVKVEKLQKNIISSLATVVEERDESTGDHIQRTMDYVEKLLTRMKSSGRYSNAMAGFNNIVLAAPMHDIGKIRVPDAILNKPGRLNAEEFEIMKKHSEFGGNIIRRTMSDVTEKEFCEIACNIARYHHERYDWNGYPDGLKGEEIPLEARVMALADVYDALISERVYKRAFSKEEAIGIIKDGSGTQFDPNLVPLFLECVE